MVRGAVAAAFCVLAAGAVLALHGAPVANSVRDAYNGPLPVPGRIVPLRLTITVKHEGAFDIARGELRLPSASIDLEKPSSLCTGKVTLSLLRDGQVIAHKRRELTVHCRYKIKLEVTDRTGKKLRARFGGNRFVAPVRSRIVGG